MRQVGATTPSRRIARPGSGRRGRRRLSAALGALFAAAPPARPPVRRARPTGIWAAIESGFGTLPRRWGLMASLALFLATGLYAAALNGGMAASAAVLSGALRPVAAAVSPPVERIDIVGAPAAKLAQARAAIGAAPGDAILWFDTDAARVRLEALAWVRRAEVQRLLPGTLKVQIEARSPYAIWQHDGQLAVVDREGVVVADARSADHAGLPLVVGLGANVHAEEFLALLDRRPALRARMRAAIRVADRRWNIRLLNGVDVRLPEHDVAAALDELVALDETSGLLSRDIAAVDLRLADRITIRLGPDSAGRPGAAGMPAAPARARRGADT